MDGICDVSAGIVDVIWVSGFMDDLACVDGGDVAKEGIEVPADDDKGDAFVSRFVFVAAEVLALVLIPATTCIVRI